MNQLTPNLDFTLYTPVPQRLQVKFRSGRPNVLWELKKNFMDEAPLMGEHIKGGGKGYKV